MSNKKRISLLYTVEIFASYCFTVFGHYVLRTPIQLVSVLFIAALYTVPNLI